MIIFDVTQNLQNMYLERDIASFGLPRWHIGKEFTCREGDQDTQVWSLVWEDPLEEEMAIHSSISDSSAFSKYSLNIWKFSVHVLLKPHLETFEHYFASMGDECNCAVVWRFFGIAFLWNWNENTFSSPVATAEFSKFAGILSATF